MLGGYIKRVPRRTFTEEFKKEFFLSTRQQDLTVGMSAVILILPQSHLKFGWNLYVVGILKASTGVAKLMPDQLRIRELELDFSIARE